MYLFTTDDRIPVKIGDVTFWISPLTNDTRADISTAVSLSSGKKRLDVKKLYSLYIKYAVKRIDGVKLPRGGVYKVKKDKKGNLTETCLKEVLNLSCAPMLAQAALSLFSEIKPLDIEGVVVDIEETIPEKKLESLSL